MLVSAFAGNAFAVDINCSSGQGKVKPAGTLCHTGTGGCDVSTFCNGVKSTCPSGTAAANGNGCDDGDGCTSGDACQSGNCRGSHINANQECGAQTCGTSPSGCNNCGQCGGGAACTAGQCVAIDLCASVTCGQCQKCQPASGKCVADGQADGTGCVGEQSGLCFASSCSGGACATTQGDFDGTPPDIACDAPVVVQCSGNGQGTASSGASATDQCSIPTTTCAANGPTFYAVGSYTNACSAIDGNGDTASCGASVSVVDTTAPAVTCSDSAEVWTSSQGGLCSASLAASASGIDVCWGDTAGTCGSGTLTVSGAPGTAATTCTATDNSGNTSAECGISLKLNDDTAPVITGPAAGSTVYVLGACAGGSVALGVTASDNCAAAPTLACSALASNSFGANAINCTATDASGNSASLDYTVVVLEPLRVAFTSPLADDNLANNYKTDTDIINNFKSGSTVPHKVRLYNCSNADVSTSAAVTVRINATEQNVAGQPGGELDLPENFNGTGDAGGLLRLTDGHWQFNLNTSGFEAGTVNNNRFFQSLVTVEYNAAIGTVAGAEDARLESK